MDASRDEELCELLLAGIRRFSAERLPLSELLRLDEQNDGSAAARALAGELGIATAFLPQMDEEPTTGMETKYRIAEALGRVDLGIATSLLATLLGLDPILVGGTEQQRGHWAKRVKDGCTMAYCATEPRGGSDLSRLETRAVAVDDGRGRGYLLRGRKQWITNAGVAQAWTVLARTPSGPSWFIVDGAQPGLGVDAAEDKHGIRLSNTAAMVLDDVFVPRSALVGEREGLGLAQAVSVFGFTRVMVAAFALGSGWVALEAAVRYAQSRRVGSARLCDIEGFAHKLLVPPAVALEAARAQIEAAVDRFETSGRSEAFAVEGAAAKYLASEAANFAAECAMQALGGSGYARGYGVEKIRRDVRITKIYEGTSEILEGIVGRDAWRSYLVGERYAAAGADRHLGTELEFLQSAAGVAFDAFCAQFQRHGLQRDGHCVMQLGALAAHLKATSALATPGGPRRSPLSELGRGAIARMAHRDAVSLLLSAHTRLVGGACGAEQGPEIDATLLGVAFRAQRGRSEDARVITKQLVTTFRE